MALKRNPKPLYQSHETIVLERPRRRRLPRLAAAIGAITLAGALIGNGLLPGDAPAAPRPAAAVTSRGERGDLVVTVPAGAPAATVAPVAPAPTAAAATTAAPAAPASAAPAAATTPVAAGTRLVVRGVSNGLFVRSEPSTEAPALGAIVQGDIVTVTGAPIDAAGHTWLPVRAGKLQGWVAAEFLGALS